MTENKTRGNNGCFRPIRSVATCKRLSLSRVTVSWLRGLPLILLGQLSWYAFAIHFFERFVYDGVSSSRIQRST